MAILTKPKDIPVSQPQPDEIVATPPKPHPSKEDRVATVETLKEAVAETSKPIKFRTDKKTRITIWIDNDILEAFRSTGRDWHPRINEALRKAIEK